MKKFTLAHSALVAAVLSALPMVATADTIDLTLTTLGNGSYVNVSSNAGSSFRSVFAGEFGMLASNSTNTSALPNGAYDIFCLELNSPIYSGTPYRYNVVGLGTVNPNGTPGALGATGAEAIQDMWNFANGRQYDTNDFATAFQLALWEVTFDGTNDSRTGGTFRFNGGSAVNAIVADLFNSININGTTITLAGLTNGNAQDLLVNPNQNEKVSEPGSLAMLGLGLLGLGTIRRRK